MADLFQSVAWPGVDGALSCQGTISHGINPATFVLTTLPQFTQPSLFGDLVFADGERVAPIRDCRVNLLTGTTGADGTTWVLEILDRRWRWATGAVGGRFCAVDEHGKLVPWLIRSPAELAKICLDAMGETGYLIDLPQGLSKADGADFDRYLRLGENFKQSLCNPPQTWDYTVPAGALARLCEYFGRRVVYQPFHDRVVIAQLGVGSPLPDGPCEMLVSSVETPKVPAGVGVAGAPIKFQARFALEPVALEWDRANYVPANAVSYAPRNPNAAGKPQISTITYRGTPPPPSLFVVFTWADANGQPRTVQIQDTDPGHTTIAQRWAGIVAAIAANPDLAALVTAVAAGNVLTITGRQVGQAFGVTAYDVPSQADFFAEVTQLPTDPKLGGSWESCPPPTFYGVVATDELSVNQATDLARQSVFRCYRIKNVSAYLKKPPLTIPAYGPIKRRQQIVLQQTKTQMLVPQARLNGGVVKGGAVVQGAGIILDTYDGYSRDQKAVVYGSISKLIGTVLWDGSNDLNTAETDRVFVNFTIDPVHQLVIFDDYVYKATPAGGANSLVAFPELVLETGCYIEDAETGQVARFTQSDALGGPAPVEWSVREDLQLGVVGTYTTAHALTGYTFVDEADAKARSRYYLDGMKRKYQLPVGETRQYVGVWPIDPDGLIQQVSLSVGSAGPTTVASTNTEHSSVIPTYPTRRRAENLPANNAAAIANMIESVRAGGKLADPLALFRRIF